MKKTLSQEWLKGIACVCMLLDHIGAVFLPGVGLRLIGRIAFPIYCFLLCEGARHTRHPARYAGRLAVGAVLSELPFDLVFFGGFTWQHQSVMVTLLLSYLMLRLLPRAHTFWTQAALCLPFALVAELLGSDYGFWGVTMVFLFHVTRDIPQSALLQGLFLALMGLVMPSAMLFGIPIQSFACAAMIPIGLYSGHKASDSPALQWAFYLFYPAHLLALWLLTLILY